MLRVKSRHIVNKSSTNVQPELPDQNYQNAKIRHILIEIQCINDNLGI